MRRLDDDWIRPPPSHLGPPSTFKIDGELTFLNFRLLYFLPMAHDSVIAAPFARSSLEWDYEYDKDNTVFLFYPSRPAFELSRDELFPPVR